MKRGLSHDGRPDASPVPGRHVDESVFNQGCKHEQQTRDHPYVDGLDVRDLVVCVLCEVVASS